jgi:hypothetical protein
MYFTEVRRTEVMGESAPEAPSLGHLHLTALATHTPTPLTPSLRKA